MPRPRPISPEVERLAAEFTALWGRPIGHRSDLERATGISSRTFESLALTGGGPPYSIAGRKAVYTAIDVACWLHERRRLNTSDPGGAADARA